MLKQLLFKLLNKFLIFNLFNFSHKIIINNKEFTIPNLPSPIFFLNYYSEPWMLQLLNKLLKIKGGTFIDIGMNIGQTLLMFKSLNTQSDYIGFEPNPFCVHYVELLVTKNKLSNVIIVPVGLGNETFIAELNYYSDSTTDSAASIVKDFRKNNTIIKKSFVPVFSGDLIMKNLKIDNIGIIKIDVEGLELEVLRGLLLTIKEQIPIVIIEILPAYKSQNNQRLYNQNEIVKLVRLLDYCMFRIIKKNDQLLTLKELFEIEIHSDIKMCDYLLVPKSMKKIIQNIFLVTN